MDRTARREVSVRVLALGSGVFFGAFMGLFGYLDDRQPWIALVVGLLSGAAFGTLMGLWVARQRRRAVAALGSSRPTAPPDELRRAVKNPAAVEPAVRAEALRITEFQLAEFRRTRLRNVLIFGVALVLEVFAAITGSPWFWLAVGLFAGALVLTSVAGARLQRTVHRLRASVPPM